MTFAPALIALPSASPPTSGAAPPGSHAPPGAPPFDSALADHWARTANAEGQKQNSPHGDSTGSSSHRRLRAGVGDADAAGGQAAAVTTAQESSQAPPQGALSQVAAAAPAGTTTPASATTLAATMPASADASAAEPGATTGELLAASPASASSAVSIAGLGEALSAQPAVPAPAASGSALVEAEHVAGAPIPQASASVAASTQGASTQGASTEGASTRGASTQAAAEAQSAEPVSAPATNAAAAAPLVEAGSPSTTTPLSQGPPENLASTTLQGATAGQTSVAEGPALAGASSTVGQPPNVANAAEATAAVPTGGQTPPAAARTSEAIAQASTAAAAPASQSPANTSAATSAPAQGEGGPAAGSGAVLAAAAEASGTTARESARDGQAEGETPREEASLSSAKSLAGPIHPAAASGGAVAPSGTIADVLAPPHAAPAVAASTAGLAAGSGIDLQQTIEAVRATIALAARQGVSQARIALQPQELGDIRIHLTQTSDGLLARLTADTPAGAQALAGGRAELHQSLSSLGVSLLRLDIGSGQYEAGDRQGRFGANPNGSSDGSSASSARLSSAEELDSAEAALEPDGAPLSSALQSGGLVDVLA